MIAIPGDEFVDLVDAHDAVVGRATIGRCLREGLLHRAVAVQIVRSNGKFLLQQRSRRDVWHPGLWTLSSTGHVKEGEGYGAAARREMREELGIEGKLEPVRKYKMPRFTDKGSTEYEWVSFFLCFTDSKCAIDPVELEGVKEVTEGELRAMVAGGPLTPDAKLILADYLKRKP